jgi:glycerol-3-phosphate dehydrogenase (NAD(P)+)
MNVTIVGAGAWGTALAVSVAARHTVSLVARDREHAQVMGTTRENQRYLADVVIPPGVHVLTLDEWQGRAQANAKGNTLLDLTIVATPMAGLRTTLACMPPLGDIAWLCKGFEQGSGLLGHEVAAQALPLRATALVSGPSFALEVAKGQPTALLVASVDVAVRARVADVLRSEAVRAYTSDDPVGVAVGGAMKNVMALAAGLCDGLAQQAGPPADTVAPGTNARAALITRGLAEMTRLGVALGASPLTFMGLSGLGDLVLTATGPLSRNRHVGLALAAGQPLSRVVQHLGHVAEGVLTAPVALARGRALGVSMPITQAVVAVLEGQCTAQDAVQALMARDPKAE